MKYFKAQMIHRGLDDSNKATNSTFRTLIKDLTLYF